MTKKDFEIFIILSMVVIFSNHIVQSNRVVLGLTRLREMARLTVWSVNKAGCMAIAVLCV